MAIHPYTPKKFASREGKPPPASTLLNEGGNMFPSQTLTHDIKGIALANKEFHKENLCA
jgi:hypothetical protein